MCFGKAPDPPKQPPAQMTYETETNGVTENIYTQKGAAVTQGGTPSASQPGAVSRSSGLNASSSRNSGRDSHEPRM